MKNILSVRLFMKNQSGLPVLFTALCLLLGACTTPSPPGKTTKPDAALPAPAIATLKAAAWHDLPDWSGDDMQSAWQAFLKSCTVLKNRPLWTATCASAASMPDPDNTSIKHFFENHLFPYQVINADGGNEGLVTGYYEPLLKGSRKPSERYRYPVFGTPDDLLVIDLGAVYPELKTMRLRGRLQGKKIVPYYSRAELTDNPALLQGRELAWTSDAVELFFLQIQGSGRIQMENGEMMRVGYAEQNGHPYKSVGKILVERGDLPLEKASMQGIKAWGRENPDKLNRLLQQNASFVFFRELPVNLAGPPGSLGVPLTAERSLAVDPRAIPQGAPVFLATTWPDSDKPLNRLMVAQDTGGAIKGGVRADFFWGFGPKAENQAGKMKQKGKMWVLLPQGYIPE